MRTGVPATVWFSAPASESLLCVAAEAERVARKLEARVYVSKGYSRALRTLRGWVVVNLSRDSILKDWSGYLSGRDASRLVRTWICGPLYGDRE